MQRRTPTYLLADYLLPGGLEEFVKTRRATGMSWRRIALDIRDATDRQIDVTYELLRRWFKDDDPANGGEEAA